MNYRGIKYSSLVLLLILVASCGPGRSVSEPTLPPPGWVNSRPVTPGYYTGTGWSQKTADINQFQQTARKNALADLAGEISVTISSSSVIHAFESRLGYREDFSSTIQARTMEELEGYEIAGIWEDHDNYWVYYRLPVAVHRELKEKKRNDAATLAAGIFQNAMEIKETGDLRLSLIRLINALEAIGNYLDEPLIVEYAGKDIQLGIEIVNEIYFILNNIDITPEQPEIMVKRGENISQSLLQFKVKSREGIPLEGFPLVASYSERPLRNNRVRTERTGIGGYSIDAVRSNRSSETFTVMADIENIISEATRDPLTRQLVRRFPAPSAKVAIAVMKPVIHLKSVEENLGKEIPASILGAGFQRNAIASGYIFDEQYEPDFTVKIITNTISSGASGVYKSVTLKGYVTVENSAGRIIYMRELEGFRGTHFDYERAGEEAYRQASKRMEGTIFREIDDALSKGTKSL